MDKRTTRVSVLALSIATAACTTTGENYDHAVDFSRYSTFAFVQRQRAEVEGPVTARIEGAIRADLTRRNFRLVSDPGRADFVVDFTVVSQERTDAPSVSIDVLDQRSNRTIWHGWSKQEFPARDPTDSEKPVQQIVVAVLAWFPPGRLHP